MRAVHMDMPYAAAHQFTRMQNLLDFSVAVAAGIAYTPKNALCLHCSKDPYSLQDSQLAHAHTQTQKNPSITHMQTVASTCPEPAASPSHKLHTMPWHSDRHESSRNLLLMQHSWWTCCCCSVEHSCSICATERPFNSCACITCFKCPGRSPRQMHRGLPQARLQPPLHPAQCLQEGLQER